MRRRLLLAMMALVAVAMTAAACSGDDSEPLPTPTAVPSATPTPNIYATPASGFLCPVADSSACRLAIDLQTAMDTKDVVKITSLMLPVRRSCRELTVRVGEDVGCVTPDQTSQPVVRWFRYNSDCCFALPLVAAGGLADFIDASPGGWRVVGILQSTPLWSSQYAILLSAGPPNESPVIEFGLSEEQSGRIAGAIYAPVGPPYIHPDALLVRWP